MMREAWLVIIAAIALGALAECGRNAARGGVYNPALLATPSPSLSELVQPGPAPLLGPVQAASPAGELSLVPEEPPTLPPGRAWYFWSPTEPAIELPTDMARSAGAVLTCENRHLDPGAISETGDWGLWQINRRWQEGRAARMDYHWEQMLEAGPNTAVAEAIWQEQGWTPWSCKP